MWWFANDDDPVPPADYEPTWSPWLRRLAWLGRNPLHNFTNYVIGVADRDITVHSPAPVLANFADLGWKWSIISIGRLRLPYISYASPTRLSYLGWRPYGDFGIKSIPR